MKEDGKNISEILVTVHVLGAVATRDGIHVSNKPEGMTVEEWVKAIRSTHEGVPIRVVTEVGERVDTDTGEIHINKPLNPLRRYINQVMKRSKTRLITDREYNAIKPYAITTQVFSGVVGVSAAVLFGKTAVTGFAIGLGSYIVSEMMMYQPRQRMYKHLIKK